MATMTTTKTITTASGSTFILWDDDTQISRVGALTTTCQNDITAEDFILGGPLKVGVGIVGNVGPEMTPLRTSTVMSIVVEHEED